MKQASIQLGAPDLRMETESSPPRGFVQSRLPWLVAGGALLIYLLTLSRGVTYNGLPLLMKSADWDWIPTFVAPLTFLVTFPVRWFPAGWQPVVMNLMASVF